MTDVHGKRYGEVLLVRMEDGRPEATVYNTFPLNDCPAAAWQALDAQAIAAEHGAAAALLNGPRYWLMSGIEKEGGTAAQRVTFGGIEMLRQATVALSSMNPGPYSPNMVDRKAVFTFAADREVYELVDADDRRWIMQTFSQTVDLTLSFDDLPGLGSRLHLPAGWRFEVSTPSQPIRVDTTNSVATVLQDDLANSYSLRTD